MKPGCLVLFSAILVQTLVFSIVYAQVASNITFQDLDDDGDPDLAILKTDFNRGKGKVFVYDEDDDMMESQDIKNCCDFDSDIWIFEHEGDGRAQLIIDFGRYDGELAAYLYDDQDGDGKVAYSYNPAAFQIEESEFWTLLVVGKDGFWTKGDKISYNVLILGNAKINIGNMGAGSGITDSEIDFKVRVYDVDGDFDPDFELRGGYGGEDNLGSLLNVDYGDRAKGIEEYLFWPFLGSGHRSWTKKYNEGPAPIRMDWGKAKITVITEVVPSRGGEVNYFVFSTIYRNKVNYLPGENPFAFYDLADDNDGYPELIVRMVEGPFYKEIKRKFTDRYYGNIRYTWDQDNDNRPDYRMGLIGRVNYSYIVEYPSLNFSVSHISYPILRDWIFNQSWQVATFAVDENKDEISSEGIYENGLFRGEIERAVLIRGEKLTPPKVIPIPAKLGDREEYAFNLNKKPMIYYSPIDGKLHLLNADYGIWILSAEKRKNRYAWTYFTKKELITGNASTIEKIEYRNLDGDEYLDQWTRFLNDRPVEHLIYSNGFLIFSSSSSIKLLKTPINQSLFEAPPPRNFKEWKAIGVKLSNYKKNIQATDFLSMFNQFEGNQIQIEDAYLSDFYLTPKGFRFTLNCRSVCMVNPLEEIMYKEPLIRGRYILEYDGKFAIHKVIKPDLQVGNISFSKDIPTELEYIAIKADIHYQGLENIGPILVQFYDGDPEANGTLLREQNISFRYDEKIKKASMEWLPKREIKGIYVKIDPFNLIHEINELNNHAFKPITVMPVERLPSFERLVTGSMGNSLVLVLVIFLAMLGFGIYIQKIIFY